MCLLMLYDNLCENISYLEYDHKRLSLNSPAKSGIVLFSCCFTNEKESNQTRGNPIYNVFR